MVDRAMVRQIKTISHLCCTTPRISTKSNKIDKNLVPWMSKISFFFFLLAKYSQARDQSVTRISFTKQFQCAIRPRKSTLIRSAKLL